MLKNKIYLELIGWLLAGVILILALLPIYTGIGDRYPFYEENIMFILIAVTFIRYIFLLKHHWLAVHKWIKVIFIFVPIPIFFYLLSGITNFQAFSDEVGVGTLLSDLDYNRQSSLAKYIRAEMLLFWTAAFIANAYMPIRMIISLWREINKGTH